MSNENETRATERTNRAVHRVVSDLLPDAAFVHAEPAVCGPDPADPGRGGSDTRWQRGEELTWHAGRTQPRNGSGCGRSS
jgi:hypothetical protein